MPHETRRRFLILANPIAGGGRGKTEAPRLQRCLRARGCEAELFFSAAGGDLGRRAAEVQPGEYAGLLVAGGDGSVLEVLNGLPSPHTPLGHLPMGTANVLAVELGLPWRPEGLAALAVENRHRAHPVGVCNGRRFLLFASAGLDAEIVAHLEAHRSGTLGMLKWTPSVWHLLRHWPQRELCAELPGGERIEGLSQALVTRVRNYGGLLTLPAEIDAARPELHLLGFRCRSRGQWLGMLLKALCGQLRPGPLLVHRRCQSLRIHSQDCPYQLDGDLGGHGVMELSLLPQAARIFAVGPQMP